MPTSKTKELAKKLGLLKRKRKAEDEAGGGRKRRRGQVLSYVIVIDFESTCWKEKKGTQEIIEFPAVLLDLQTGDIVDEFQQYVQPQECPILSTFCKELTGISQAQADGGIPLPTCLYLFGKWVGSLREGKRVCLMEPGQEYSSQDSNLCALATWSDWDLGVCLHYECRRKQIRRPLYFHQWIDLRMVYKEFYDRKPSGLCGSLEDLGIPFTGREHCGLDDARNTAKLCYRLVKDGCRLNITRSLWKKRTTTPAIRAPDKSEEAGRPKDQCTAHKPVPQGNQPLFDHHRSLSTAEENPTVSDKENTGGNVQVEPLKSVRPGSTPVEKGEVSGLSDESFLNGIAHEIEELERNNFSEVATTTVCTHTDKSRETEVLAFSKPTARGNSTPSRSNFLSHIAPVTLLPPHQGHISSHARQPACRPVPSLLLSPLVTRTSTSPPAHRQITTSSTESLHTNENDHSTLPHRPATAADCNTESVSTCFRTPSTMQWMRVKSFQSTSSLTSSSDSPRPFNGGKLTPPLCGCGRRARRRLATSPGPNQGRPFFSCPAGTGCQYFRWESPPDSDTFSSEYSS